MTTKQMMRLPKSYIIELLSTRIENEDDIAHLRRTKKEALVLNYFDILDEIMAEENDGH